MNSHISFSDSFCEEQAVLAERELSSFIAAVIGSYGPVQAKLAAEDWLHESALMDNPRWPKPEDWRGVTIAAAARLANRINAKITMPEFQPLKNRYEGLCAAARATGS